MATRSLTDAFILMRNNAIQSRHIYSEQNISDRMALVSRSSDIDLESGIELRGAGESQMPPAWTDELEEAQYALQRIRNKLRQLSALHAKQLQRPTLDESHEEELQIETLSQEISRMFSSTHRLIQQIQSAVRDGFGRERELAKNVVNSLATSLQELSNNYKGAQGDFLRKLNSREEWSRQYFDNPLVDTESALSNQYDWEGDKIDEQFGRLSSMQLVQLEEENTQMIQQREREVSHIVKSIADLNAIFKDLSYMVADQGMVIDRIDYNLEQTQTSVSQGLQQLQKAEQHQRKNRKMYCIFILAATTILLIFILVLVKS